LEALWASRTGLFQDELLAIAKLTPAQWAQIQNSLEESLYESSGRINFGHDNLRRAVEERYEIRDSYRISLHRKLAQWYMMQTKSSDILLDLVWQLQQDKMIAELILIPELMETLSERERKILRCRFGVANDELQTLKTLGRSISLDAKTVRRIEVKALRKLLHPRRFERIARFFKTEH
jgi:DNA-directed RNA polymerase specialized sigma subunit